METRKIGSLNVSVIGLGCNNFGRRLDFDGSAAVVRAALDTGINFFDTADVYGSGQSEEYLGRVLGQRRKEGIIATKFGSQMQGQGQGASPAYIRRAVEASLRRLGTDYIDLYQLHSPDPDVPIAETLGALTELVQSGKVREIGCSNFSAEQIREAAAVPNVAHFVSVQNEYSLLKRDPEAEVLPECERLGMAFIPYYPLAAGLLTGKYRQGQPVPGKTRITMGGSDYAAKWLQDRNLSRVEALMSFAESRGHTLLELAFSWLLHRPAVASVIAGAMTPQQVQANVAARWPLTEADLAQIDRITLQPST
jgi:aryl-alcohol dehydrogenase-like predicted oxidoreductase